MTKEDLLFIADYILATLNEWGFGDELQYIEKHWQSFVVAFCVFVIYLLVSKSIRQKNVKTIYFVRHGETILNAAHIRQGAEGKLSENGIQQAEAVAETLKKRIIDVIFASPFERTQQTASIIANVIGKNIITTELLAERRNPSEIIGKSYDDPEVVKIVNLIDKGFHEDGLRYSDEENFDDLMKRAEKLLAFIESRPETHILMVTHGIFLKMVISYMIKREKLTAADYIKYSYYNNATNAGLTICTFDPSKKKSARKGWELLVWDNNRQ